MDPDKERKQVYTPHLKKVLRSFQASANRSLHGPNSVMGMWRANENESTSSQAEANSTTVVPTTSASTKQPLTTKSPEEDPFTAPPPFPIQQPPIFTPPDQSGCEKTDTILENETISCFSVGGEKRLCLPQILNTVLRDFSLPQINCVCDSLQIFCSRCTSEQLEVLKSTGVLPLNAPSCGLITKSDAERLCAALLDSHPPKAVRNPDVKPHFQLRVHHECFGKCTGLYTPELYMDPLARCIECTECHGLFNPQKFVCHAHHPKENRTCHWGFDSFNWRCYLILDAELEEDMQMKEILKEMKDRYDYCPQDYNHKYKRKQVLTESRDPSKRLRIENFYPYPYAIDPSLVYWYPNPAWNKVATFKPLPPVITSDDKPYLIHPEALPHFFKERSPYFLNDSALLQSTDHVLPLRESERYETHYHASVGYVPAAIHKLGIKKGCEQDDVLRESRKLHKASELGHKKYLLKKEQNCDASSCCFDSEDTFSDTSSSTLSANADEALPFTGEEEEKSPCTTEVELQSLALMLSESGLDSMISTKFMTEVESIVTKYRKCLTASVQSKKLMQTEFEKVHLKQRDKIRKLKEMNRYMEREMIKLQKELSQAKISESVTAIAPKKSEAEATTTESNVEESVASDSPAGELEKETADCPPEEDKDKLSSNAPKETLVKIEPDAP